MKQYDNRLTYMIDPDLHPLNPREEYDHLGRMACWHPRYSLGDTHQWDTAIA